MFIQQGFCFIRFCCFLIAVLINFSRRDFTKCQDIKEKIELLGSNQLHIMLEDSGLHENASCSGERAGFSFDSDFNIDFHHLLIKRHGFTYIFNFLKSESCMGLKLVLRSGFELVFKITKITETLSGR